MAIEIATAFVQIVPSMKGVGKAIESAFGSASETAGNTAGIKAGNGFAGGFGAKLGVITGIAQSVAGKAIEAFMGLSGEITSASDSAQKFASTLNFAGVSEQQIKRLTASTQDYADKTVYDLNDIRNTTAQLAANGVPNYDKLAEAAGNLNAVAGGSADTFKSVAMVLTQTAGQGKLTLALVGGSQVDRDAGHREGEAAVFNGGAHPVPGLLHRRVRQAHDLKGGQTGRQVALCPHLIAGDPAQPQGAHFTEHGCRLLSLSSCCIHYSIPDPPPKG